MVNNKELINHIYSTIGLGLIAVDESHCISIWGSTFRSDYKHLGYLKNSFPNVPILALTGTATPLVQQDICNGLMLNNPLIIRPNLSYYVFKKSKDIWQDLNPYLSISNPENIIIYCQTRDQTETIANLLKSNGHSAEAYHAKMTPTKRREVQNNFIQGITKCIVATISFGMGIDKADIRKVIHYGCSSDIESYLQETGRAGRDGNLGQCIIFYSESDFRINRYHISQLLDPIVQSYRSKMQTIIENYLNSPLCRRKYLLSYFNESLPTESSNPCCDNCLHENKIHLQDITYEVKFILQLINDNRNKYGKTKLIDCLLGKKLNLCQIY